MTFTFRAAGDGGWLAFVATPRLLVVEAHDDAFTASAWNAVRSDDGFQAALDLLTSKGLAATPAFVLAEWEPGGAARVIVRGDSVVRLTDGSGEVEHSGAGASTWAERTFPAVDSILFEVPGATAVSGDLPIESGVVSAASLRTAGASASAGVPVAKPAKTAPPKTVPAEKAAPVVVATPAPAAQPAPAAPPAPVAQPAPVEVDVEATVREAPDAEAPAPAERDEFTPPGSNGYHDLFGDTMFRDVSDAVVREPDAEDDTPVIDDELHDGETVMTSDIAKIRGRRAPKRAPDAPAPQQAVVLVISPGGAREPLVGPVLIGRSPSVSKVSGGQIPRLLTVGTADQDISRNHAQLTLEGDTVVVTDLHSRNGTTITLPGKPTQKLRAGEPMSIIVGTVVDFGGGVTLTVEKDS